MMPDIKKIMTGKLVTIGPENSVRTAIELMEHYKIGCLPVLKENQLIGLITSRDIKRAHPNRLVADAMSKNTVTITSDCSPWEAKKLMDQHEIERLIVVERGCPVGLVTKAQLYSELGKYMDPLTGLNRAEFLRYKALELMQAGQEICIIFFDLDNFGTINKEFGHVTGDEILCGIARILAAHLDTATDYLCRYAGDEFAIVSIKCLDEAKKLINRIFADLEAENWPQDIKVTVSVGIAGGQRVSCRHGNLTKVINDLINMASLASTKAKHENGSLVVTRI